MAGADVRMAVSCGSRTGAHPDLTRAQLRLHARPCGLVKVRGDRASLFTVLDIAITSGFLRAAHRGLVVCDPSPDAVLDQFVFASQAR